MKKKKMKNDSGTLISDQKAIITGLHTFYQSLYSSKSFPGNKNNIASYLDNLDDMPLLSDDSKTKLNIGI